MAVSGKVVLCALAGAGADLSPSARFLAVD
jgi:hypothetical protein